jgi:hypothetical protein
MEFIVERDTQPDTESISVVGCGMALETKKEIQVFNWYTGQVIGSWKHPGQVKYFYFNENLILLQADGLVVVKKAVRLLLLFGQFSFTTAFLI